MSKKSTGTKQPASKPAQKPNSSGKTLEQLRNGYKNQPLIPIDNVIIDKKGK